MIKQVLVLGLLVAAMSPLSTRAGDALQDCLATWDQYLICHGDITNWEEPTVSCEKSQQGGFGIFFYGEDSNSNGSTVFIDLAPDSCAVGIEGSKDGINDYNNCNDGELVTIELTKKQRARLKRSLKTLCSIYLR